MHIHKKARPETIKPARGIWLLLKEELEVLLTQNYNNAIVFSGLEPYSSDSDIEQILLSFDDYHGGTNIVTFNDLVIPIKELTTAKKIYYAKDDKEKESDPKHLEKIRKINNGLINAIHSEEPYDDLEEEKAIHCPTTNDYQVLIASLKKLYFRFAELDPPKRMKIGKPISGDKHKGVVGALREIDDFEIKGKTILQDLFREAMEKG